MMNNYMLMRTVQVVLINVSIMAMVLISEAATAGDRGPSYSPDHWPNRWTSAIRQQQSGQYPARVDRSMPPPELPNTYANGEVSEMDLFYAPQNKYRRNHYQRGNSYRQANYHRSAHPRTEQRRAAFAYHSLPVVYPTPGYPGTTNNNIAIDPVLGHPGIGIPVMPGTPYGYPFIGMSPLFYPTGFGSGYHPGFFNPVYPGMSYW